ncbi:hypothetical protein ACFL12_07235 [Pseudomonadota bacterium]
MNLTSIHSSRRAMVRGLLLASGFAPVLLTALARAGANSKVPVVPGVQEARGDVRINDRSVQVGHAVNPGDRVNTGADGSCVIIIGEHVYLIRENSEVEFYAEDFAEGLDHSISGKIKMTAGAMLSVFGRTETDIVTPTGTIGIRGTACYVDAAAARTYACVCYGRGELSGTQDAKHLETVVSEYHDSPRYIYPSGAATRIEKAPVIDHTDAELRMLEALVNRRPPFDKRPKKERGY